MSYLGDAELGDGTNVGAGTITANYDGRSKHRTTIGERVFLGVDTMLVAPVDDRRRREDRRRRGRHEGRAGRASSPSGCRPGCASPRAGRAGRPTAGIDGRRLVLEILVLDPPDLPRGLLRRRRDRPRVDPPEPRRAARRGGQLRRPARPAAARRARPVPRRLPARPDLHRLLRLGLRRGQPRRRARRGCSTGVGIDRGTARRRSR